MGMVDDGHVTHHKFVYRHNCVCGRSIRLYGLRVTMSDHYYYYYYYCCCLGRVQHSLITFDVVLSLVHRLHSVFALVMFYVKSGLLQVFGITEFADESQERREWKGVWIGGGKGNVGLGVVVG